MARQSKPYYQIIALIVVLLIAALLRLYRIAELTEFLGDQGRTGIHIYEAWQSKQWPMVGPTVLSGQYLGPAFYYLMAPSLILSGFNPLAPAIFTALLGVLAVGLLWWLSKEFFGWQIATMLGALWAVSPEIVSSDRVLWEPNVIPFFIFLYLVAIYKVKQEAYIIWSLTAGVAVGILVQLHYPNLLFVVLTVLFYLGVWQKRKIKTAKLFKVMAGAVLGFVLVLLPFLIYESSQGFTDVVGILKNFFDSPGLPLAKRQVLTNLFDYSGRVIRRAIPIPSGWEAGTLMVFLALIFLKPTFWKLFIGLWLVAGLTAMSLYRGVVFDHYLFFLLPAPFLLLGFFLQWLARETNIWVPLILAGAVVSIHLSRTDITKEGLNDLSRVRAVTQEIQLKVGSEPFSFALLGSRSFSDLHYRFYFLTQGTALQPLLANTYRDLFLVCEADDCPTAEQLIGQRKVQIICYKSYCGGEYPIFDLSTWKLGQVTDTSKVRVYHFRK